MLIGQGQPLGGSIELSELASAVITIGSSNVVSSGTAANFTTTSTTVVNLTNATKTFTTKANGEQLIIFSGDWTNSGTANNWIQLLVAGTAETWRLAAGRSGAFDGISLHFMKTGLAAASTIFKVQCNTDAGTLTIGSAVAGGNQHQWEFTVHEFVPGG